VITIDGDIEAALRERLLEIADRCPVHRTLTERAAIVTTFGSGGTSPIVE
jgi:putative redox protein